MERLSLKLGVANDDLIVKGGRFDVIEGPMEVEQAIRLRLRLWQGERYVVPSDGVPYHRYFTKGFPPEIIQHDILMELYADQRVELVNDLEVGPVDAQERRIEVHFEAITVHGDILRGGERE